MTDKKSVSIEMHRCPNCGASDVSTNTGTGKLRCKYCKHEFENVASNNDDPSKTFENVKGDIVSSGASNIVPGQDVVVTLKCPSCGAEVVVNTAEDLSINCHWCRHVLTASHKIPNGAVPDILLPFSIKKADAQEKIKTWLAQYKEKCPLVDQLNLDEMQGVYFPYWVVDVKGHMTLEGEAEKTKEPGVADVYEISREFDIYVDDLTIESSEKRLYQDVTANSNNIINAILPYDTKNAVAWNPSFLRGFSSEKRDTNIDAMKEYVALQSGDIARRKAKESASQYDRGIHWRKEHLSIKGVNWKAAYLPVWLLAFSNSENQNDKRRYYVAVNARTGEVSGDLPIKGVIFGTHSGSKERHHHEKETIAEVREMKETNRFASTRRNVYGAKIAGCNDERAIGSASSGRSEMNAMEKTRFSNGANYNNAGSSVNSNSVVKIVLIILAIWFIMQFLFGGLFGLAACGSGCGDGSGNSSYDSDYSSGSSYDYDYDYDSDYDYDFDSDFDSDDGFDYDYDY